MGLKGNEMEDEMREVTCPKCGHRQDELKMNDSIICEECNEIYCVEEW